MKDKKTNRDRVLDGDRGLTCIIGEADRVGVRRSPEHCVAANRIHRIPGVLDQRVGQCSARILRADAWHRYDLHPDTIAAIRAYDDAGEVMPAGFRVVLVPPRKKLGTRAKEKPGSAKRSGKRTSVATRSPSTRSLFVEP
ncbi:MAG TPA: hypothetical protein VGF51_12240, partial [Acidimicrobiales bacterium]